MNKRRYRLAIVGALVAIAAGGVVAYAGGDTNSASPVTQLQTHPGPEAFLRAHGVNASEAQPALTLNNGEGVGVIDSGGVRCFTLSVDGTHVSGACSSEPNIVKGDAINVHDECSGKNSMAIYGLAPVGAVEVRLEKSDDTSENTNVVKGAFSFAGTNPAAGAAYPTGVQWLAAGGSSLGTAPLPVSAGQFCLPTS